MNLEQRESIIEHASNTIAEQLKAIHDEKLYVEKYRTFANYCETRWGMSRSYAYRLIGWEKMKMSPIGDTPKTEYEARKQRIAEKQDNVIPFRQPEYDHVAGSMDEINAIIESQQTEIQSLQDRLNIESMNAPEQAKLDLYQELNTLRTENKSLTAELIAVKASRDRLMEENARLQRQVNAQKRELQKQA